ncbi:MAG TPA: DoxX family protein, partial [Acetobacteraceae bacterium]
MTASQIPQALGSGLGRRLSTLAAAAADAVRIAEKTAAPFLDLFVRLWLAQIFWFSGLVKLHDWDQAVYLATHEYPVSWLDPGTAAWLGAGIEITCAPLLALGLATRLAALPMLVLALVIQYAYLPLDQHLYWAVLFAWYVARGAGPISLDHRLARGLAESALPFAAPVRRLFDGLTRWGGPLAMLLLRYWVAAVFFRSDLTKLADWDATLFLFQTEYNVPLLPPELAAPLSAAFELS